MPRVAVFIDYQNSYKGVRQAHGWDREAAQVGQVYPRRLGMLLCDRGRIVDPDRVVEYVKVYRGEPDAKRSSKGQAACQRQVRFWTAQAGVQAVTRPLKYYPLTWDSSGAPVGWEAREKGIDVLIALDMVVGAINDEYDVAVLMSADTDLVPAVEAVVKLGKRCEVGAWRGPMGTFRLSVPSLPRLWCHWLNEHDYHMVEDQTDYTLRQSAEPLSNP